MTRKPQSTAALNTEQSKATINGWLVIANGVCIVPAPQPEEHDA